MANVPKKVAERLSKQLGVFQRILRDAKDRDVNESDTVTIITDMLADLFGLDKYTEVTSEQAIRGTYCDLAVKLDDAIKYLIEVKAVGLTLKENHLRQAMNYGANQGIPWVVLTNGINWEIYRIKFERPVDCEHTCTIDILELSARKTDDIERLYLLCKESLGKDGKAAIDEFHEHTQNVNRFVVAALIQSEGVVNVLRREIRRHHSRQNKLTSSFRTRSLLFRDADTVGSRPARFHVAEGDAVRRSGCWQRSYHHHA